MPKRYAGDSPYTNARLAIFSMFWWRRGCWSEIKGFSTSIALRRRVFSTLASPVTLVVSSKMFNARLYGFWGSLTEALRTGEPQNEAKEGGDLFANLYTDPARLEGFLRAMTGMSLPV